MSTSFSCLHVPTTSLESMYKNTLKKVSIYYFKMIGLLTRLHVSWSFPDVWDIFHELAFYALLAPLIWKFYAPKIMSETLIWNIQNHCSKFSVQNLLYDSPSYFIVWFRSVGVGCYRVKSKYAFFFGVRSKKHLLSLTNKEVTIMLQLIHGHHDPHEDEQASKPADRRKNVMKEIVKHF